MPPWLSSLDLRATGQRMIGRSNESAVNLRYWGQLGQILPNLRVRPLGGEDCGSAVLNQVMYMTF